MEIDPQNHIYSETTRLSVFGNVYFISKGRLPPEGVAKGIERKKKHATTPRVLEIDPKAIYILKLHDSGYFDMYISFPKGATILKVLLKV